MRTLMVVLLLCGVAFGQQVEYPLNLEKEGIKLPKTKDPNLSYWLNDPRTVWYKLPSVYQQYIPASTVTITNGVTGQTSYQQTPRRWGLYASTFLEEFNANTLFPWDTTAGLNESRKRNALIYQTVNFHNIHEDKRILVINQYPIQWIWPTEATLGEVIYTVFEGKKYVLEIRTRSKSEDARDWVPRVFRPIATKNEFVEEVRKANFEIGDYVEAEKWMHLRNSQGDEVQKLEGKVKLLPPLPVQAVKVLLAKEFKDVTDNHWSPSATQDFHIMPRDYCFGLLSSIDTLNCVECHRQTQTSVSNLIPNDPLIHDNPTKVGNIRGSDGIFTWHPFTTNSVRQNDEEPAKPVQFRRWDIDNGYLTIVDEKEVPNVSGYKITEYVQRALKPYELPPSKFLHKKEEEKVAQE